MEEILRNEKIAAGSHVGCVGWNYYANPYLMDVPSYIVDVLRGIVGFDNVADATRLLVHAGQGLRSNCSAAEIAFFEYSNIKASEAMKRIHFTLR
jgi:hypothetical protein